MNGMWVCLGLILAGWAIQNGLEKIAKAIESLKNPTRGMEL